MKFLHWPITSSLNHSITPSLHSSSVPSLRIFISPYLHIHLLLQEGAPPGFPLIDNMLLYVEQEDGNAAGGTSGQYSASIRYSCKENYLIIAPPFYYKLFESVQIWTRDPGIISPSLYDIDIYFFFVLLSPSRSWHLSCSLSHLMVLTHMHTHSHHSAQQGNLRSPVRRGHGHGHNPRPLGNAELHEC